MHEYQDPEWESQPTHNEPDTPEGYPGSRDGFPGFAPERAHAMRGSVRSWKLVRDLFFRTWRFMLSYGVHVDNKTKWALIWLFGALTIINRVDTTFAFDNELPAAVEHWMTLFIIAGVFGWLQGALWYGVGGLWYRARLWMCGVRDVEWAVTGRVFVLVRIPEIVGGMIYFGAAMAATDSFHEYLLDESKVFLIASAPLFLLTMWTTVMAYSAARGVFFADRLWAIVWFLVLPMVIKVLALGLIVLGIWLTTLMPKPDLDSTDLHASELLTLTHPGNWALTEGDRYSGPVTLVDIVPSGHDAIVSVEVEYLGLGADPYETYEPWLNDIGFTLGETTEPITRWGDHEGIGRAYTATQDGWDYHIRLFFKHIGGDAWLAAREIVDVESDKDLMPGFEMVRDSIRVRDPRGIAPDLDRTRAGDTGVLRFEMPGNWWLQRTMFDVETDEDGNELPQGFRITATALQDSWIEFMAYTSDATPRSEVGYSLSRLGAPDRLDDEESFDEWLGIEGYGVTGIARDPERGDRRISVLVSRRANGQMLEMRKVEYLDHAGLAEPGLEMIERTFECDMD